MLSMRGLYAICDDGLRPDLSLVEKGRRLLAGGVGVIQLRAKRTPAREVLAAARELSALCQAQGAKLIVNDRIDLALLSGAHGVHVGDEDLTCADARALLGPDRLVGVTVRNLEAARAAHRAGASYAGIGPVFGTSTKAVDAPVLGVAALREIAARSPLPLVAIAGIRLDNIGEVAAAGAQCAAVASDLLLSEDLPARARALQAAFEAGWASVVRDG